MISTQLFSMFFSGPAMDSNKQRYPATVGNIPGSVILYAEVMISFMDLCHWKSITIINDYNLRRPDGARVFGNFRGIQIALQRRAANINFIVINVDSYTNNDSFTQALQQASNHSRSKKYGEGENGRIMVLSDIRAANITK
jgi:hypothetical protein